MQIYNLGEEVITVGEHKNRCVLQPGPNTVPGYLYRRNRSRLQQLLKEKTLLIYAVPAKDEIKPIGETVEKVVGELQIPEAEAAELAATAPDAELALEIPDAVDKEASAEAEAAAVPAGDKPADVEAEAETQKSEEKPTEEIPELELVQNKKEIVKQSKKSKGVK